MKWVFILSSEWMRGREWNEIQIRPKSHGEMWRVAWLAHLKWNLRSTYRFSYSHLKEKASLAVPHLIKPPCEHNFVQLKYFVRNSQKKNKTSLQLSWHFVSSLVFLPFEYAASLTTEESAPLPAEMWVNFSRQPCMHVTNRITFFSRFVPNQTRWLSLRAKRPRKLNCVP